MSLRAIAAVVVCFSIAGVAQADPQQDAERAALARLVSRLPKVDTNGVACPPFDARFEWRLKDGGYRVDLKYRRPNSLEALMTDSSDGSPCVLYRDAKISFFDPGAKQFVVAPECKLDFAFLQGPDGKAAFGSRVAFGGQEIQRVQIDLQSLMQAGGPAITNEGSDDSVTRLKLVRGDRREEIELTRSNPPVCHLKSFQGDDPVPVMEMTLTVFSEASAPLFQEPDLEELAKIMSVDTPGVLVRFTDGLQGFTAGMKTISQGYFAICSHVGNWQPTMREELKAPGFPTPDWEAVVRNKKELGPKLRELCGLPARVKPEDQPITPALAGDEVEAPK